MNYVIEMLRQGFQALGQDGGLFVWQGPIVQTVRLAVWSTAIALMLGFPVAYWIAGGSTPGRLAGRTIANAALGLPPVGVGVYAFMLMPGAATPFGGAWIGTMTGMVCVQSILSLPIIVALCSSALLGLPHGLVEQARAFGGSGWRLAWFAVREAKVGIVIAVIVSMAAAIGEVGAVSIISGFGPTETLATAVLDQSTSRSYALAFAIEDGIRMIALLLVLGALLTVVQQARIRGPRLPQLARLRARVWSALARGTPRRVMRLIARRPHRPGDRWPPWARLAVGFTGCAAAAALVGYTYGWRLPGIPEYRAELREGLRRSLDLVLHGDSHLAQVTWKTLLLALKSTVIGAAVGVPLGCVLGVGRFRGRRVVLAGANGLTKIPPVVIGLVILLLFTVESRWGGGPFAAVSSVGVRAVVGQSLLAAPIIAVLTATALQAVTPGLLEQARAFGAPAWRTSMLALREARSGVMAGVILAFGVTITAIGALAVGQGVSDTLAPLALDAFNADPSQGPNLRPTAVAYATILFVLFFVIATALTLVQRGRQTPIAGRAL